MQVARGHSLSGKFKALRRCCFAALLSAVLVAAPTARAQQTSSGGESGSRIQDHTSINGPASVWRGAEQGNPGLAVAVGRPSAIIFRDLPKALWQALIPEVRPPAWHPDHDIPKKYNVALIGERGIGGGLNFYSLDKEMALGKELSQEVESNTRLVTDPVVNEYINRIGQNLVRNSDARVPFTIKVIDSEEINAFALPGGYFYVNLGLIEAADNEAELAGAMAHEIAHVAARHATKRETKREIWDLVSIPLVFVGGPVGLAVRNVAGLAVPLSFLKFGRDAEREADLLGLEYMYASGYDPEAFVEFFEKLAMNEKKHKNFIARAFSSHPMSSDRVKRSEKEIEELLPPKEDYLLTTSEFDRVKARIARLTQGRLTLGKQSAVPTLRKRN